MAPGKSFDVAIALLPGQLQRGGGERREHADRVDLAGHERRRGGVGEQRRERDVLLGQPGLLQREQQQVVVDRALLGGDLLALEVGDRGDAGPGDDLVVAGGVVVDQHDRLLGAAADRGRGCR